LERVRHRFLDKLPDRRREILHCARQIDQFSLGTDAMAGFSHHAYKIAGVAAMLGFSTLSDAAQRQACASFIPAFSRNCSRSSHGFKAAL